MKEVFNKIIIFSENVIKSVENKKITLISWIIAVFAFSYIRGFMENIAVGSNYIAQKSYVFFLFHQPAFYASAFLLFILIAYFLTKEKIEKITKASLLLLPFILLAPIFDFLVFHGKFSLSRYPEPIWAESLSFWEMIIFYFKYSLFGPMGILNFGANSSIFQEYISIFSANYTVNYGLKIELTLIVMFFVFFVFLKTRSLLKTVLALFFSQIALFLIGYFPYLFTNFLGLPNTSGSFHDISELNPLFEWDLVVAALGLMFIFIISLIWFYLHNKRKFTSFIKNLRLPRLGMYLAAFWYGFYLADVQISLTFFDWLLLVVANLAIILSWMFAVGSNDIADEKADKISNADRPLVSGIMSKEETKEINTVLRFTSYIFAFLAGYVFFITILIRSCVSYLYSNEPFRLKRYPIISTFCIALAVLLGVLGGYLIPSNSSIYDFPVQLAVLILVVFTLSMNVIHIKDYEGDKEDGVRTIPVIFGLEGGKLIVGVMSAISFLMPSLIYQDKMGILIGPAIFCAALALYFINRKNFKEWPILVLYYVYTLPVMFYLY